MAISKSNIVMAHREREKIRNSVVPGSVRVTREGDGLVVQAAFTAKGWKAIERLGKLTNRTGDEVFGDTCKLILSRIKMPRIRKTKKTPPSV